jgi:hypothetical protein
MVILLTTVLQAEISAVKGSPLSATPIALNWNALNWNLLNGCSPQGQSFGVRGRSYF